MVNASTTSFKWTRPAVSGISNAAILAPQSGNPNEVLTNTTGFPLSVVYNFTLSSQTRTNYGQLSVVVNTTVTPVIRSTATTAFCSGKTVTLTAFGLNNYLWSNQAQTNTIIVTPVANTTYTVGGINNYGCYSGNSGITLTVMPTPTLSVKGQTALCAGESTTLHALTNGITVYWNNIAGDTLHVYTPLQSGKVITIAMGSNGCKVGDTTYISLDPCTGIDANALSYKEPRVYPNPAGGRFFIEAGGSETLHTTLYNTMGEALMKDTELSAEHGIDVSALPQGIYFVYLQQGEKRYMFKLLKE